MKNIKKYKYIILILVVIMIGLVFYLFYEEENNIVTKNDIQIVKEENVIKEEVKKIKQNKVDIKGEVKTPGVYEISENARIIDAIKLSGGLTKNADTSLINLSKVLEDEMVIYIYSKEEVNNLKINDKYIKVEIKGEVKNPNVYEIKENSRIIDLIKEAGGLTDEADTTNINLSKVLVDEMLIVINKKEVINNINEIDNKIDNKISLNKATLEELMTLSGIGESKALKIIEYRTNSPFNDISELTKVSGISNSIYEKIKDLITI